MPDSSDRIRLHKWIAASGRMSRRKAEEAMQAGRVRVNGIVMREPGATIDPSLDRVEVDGEVIAQPEARRVIALHKPPKVITTKQDPEGRRTILDLLPEELRRLNPVGRLDFESEGLILLTDDGELANRLMHPRYGVRKVYRVWVEGRPTREEVARLVRGVELEDGSGRFESVEPAGEDSGYSVFSVEVSEGRNRFVRRMWAAVGHPVARLVRTRIGGLELGSLRPGEFRELTATEITAAFPLDP